MNQGEVCDDVDNSVFVHACMDAAMDSMQT